MMRLAAIFLVCIFISCSNRSGIPGDIIPPDSMEVVMKDVVMASQYSVQFISKDTLKKDKRKANQELLEDVFKIHHITRETFKQSLRFYESRPDLNKKIFDSLSAYVSLHQKDLYAPSGSEKPHAPTNIPQNILVRPKTPMNGQHVPAATPHGSPDSSHLAPGKKPIVTPHK